MVSINVTLAIVIGVDLAMISFGRQRLIHFLQSVPHIRCRADLEYLERVAAIQMHVSLLHVCAVIAITGLFLLGWQLANFPRTATAVWVGVMVITSLLAYRGRQTAALVQAIPVSNPALAPGRKRVVNAWRQRALPDW